MSLYKTTRTLACAALLTLCASASFAHQRGPGGPPGGGGMGGPPGGGGMGGPPGHGARGGMDPDTFSPSRRGPHLGPPRRWWDEKKTAKTLNLSSDQQKRMDDIFEANKGQLLTLLGNLQVEEQRLNSMTREELQDEAKVDAAINRVAAARTELEKESAHIQLQLRKELDSTQLAMLDQQIR